MTEQRHELVLELPEEELEVEGDLTRLTQVLGNLLNNAAKYTDPGGRIVLSRVPQRARSSRLRVRDTGIGIPPELLPRLFNLFTQVDGTTHRAQGGLGIGLALVRQLVEMHGGTVTAHSAGPGRGSEFAVTLPLHLSRRLRHQQCQAATATAAVNGSAPRASHPARRRQPRCAR